MAAPVEHAIEALVLECIEVDTANGLYLPQLPRRSSPAQLKPHLALLAVDVAPVYDDQKRLVLLLTNV